MGSRYGHTPLGSGGPSLQLGTDTVAAMLKWRLTDTDLCPCGETQTMSHIVDSCPLTKLNGGLSRLRSADEDAVSWLTNYGSWHAYEKTKKTTSASLAWRYHRISVWTSTSLTCVRSVFSGFANWDESDVHSTLSPWRHSCTPLSRRASITVTLY